MIQNNTHRKKRYLVQKSFQRKQNEMSDIWSRSLRILHKIAFSGSILAKGTHWRRKNIFGVKRKKGNINMAMVENYVFI